MNYQHEFHAGNFADVFKHVVFCRILHYLRGKPAAFRVIDTHAGAGLYDLANEKSMRSGEWQSGIGKLMGARIPQTVATLLLPYLDVVRAVNERDRLRTYPGSPALARAWLRPQDRLIACELEPKAAAALSRNLHGDTRIKTLSVDGWTALNAYVPPKERRGVVLVDPPFEAEDDFLRLSSGLAAAHRKWATGIYVLWYPIKGRREADALTKRLRRLALPKVLRAEILAGPLGDPTRLNGAGMIVVNPSWTLENELSVLLPALAGILGRDGKGSFRLDRLGGEKPSASL
ncbi:MAG TPA: 23S rRNA (adenine(2030)-N(6))-methyltransferase RlmJ [Pseudolabrys sp.]|jgi:23S rRNA (adenine2030-N6)-methyltransferase